MNDESMKFIPGMLIKNASRHEHIIWAELCPPFRETTRLNLDSIQLVLSNDILPPIGTEKYWIKGARFFLVLLNTGEIGYNNYVSIVDSYKEIGENYYEYSDK